MYVSILVNFIEWDLSKIYLNKYPLNRGMMGPTVKSMKLIKTGIFTNLISGALALVMGCCMNLHTK